jgi:hypothetical protein
MMVSNYDNCVQNKNTGFYLTAFLRVMWHLILLDKLPIENRNVGSGTEAVFPPTCIFPC